MALIIKYSDEHFKMQLNVWMSLLKSCGRLRSHQRQFTVAILQKLQKQNISKKHQINVKYIRKSLVFNKSLLRFGLRCISTKVLQSESSLA